MSRAFFLAFVIIGCIGPASTLADVFYLANGGRIEGDLLNPDQSPRVSYVVQPYGGGRLTLSQKFVERVVVKTVAERRYEALLPTLPDTVESHLDMAQKCGLAGLNAQKDFHFEQVIRLDPNHEDARHALGFSRIRGRWMRQEDWMAEQGYVRHRNAWRLPYELAMDEAATSAEQQNVAWHRKLKTWRSWIIKGRDKVREGQSSIVSIRDPLAAQAIADLLDDEKKEYRELKLLYVEVLGNLPSEASVAAFVKHSLENPDSRVREACRDQLVQSKGARQAVSVLLRALKHDDQLMVKRAAATLSRLRDPSSTLPLINALITEHKVVVDPGGGIQPTFSSAGGGLNVGGGPKVEKKKFQNEPVLHALTNMHRGVNFGYNVQAWKNWYIANNTPAKLNLRRSN